MKIPRVKATAASNSNQVESLFLKADQKWSAFLISTML
jgi:hypothetical protein